MFFRSILLVCPAACLLAQTPATTPAPKPAAAKPVQKKAVSPAKPAAAKPAAAKPAATKPATTTPAVTPAPSDASSTAAALGHLPNVPPNQVVLTIGEEKITAAEFEKIIGALPEQSRAQAAGPGRKQFLDNFIRVKVLAQEGRRRQLDKSPTFQMQVALQREEFLASSTYNSLAQSVPIGPEQLEQYYQQHKGEFETARASHILIRMKGSAAPLREGKKELTDSEALAKAEEVRKQILAGGDFAAIAKKESDDGGSGVQGGDLGTFSRGRMVPAFENAVFTQPVGEVGPPVRTDYGYHIIKVVQREAKTLEQARPEIEKKLRPEAAMKMVESLRQTTNVVIGPELGGGVPSSPVPPPAK